MNYTEKGSKLYLFSIVLVAVIGGLLFGYDTAVISGADKGLQAFFMGASDFVYTDTIHGITSSSALIGCIIGSALSGFFASNLGRKNSLFIAGVLFFLSALGSYYPEFLFFDYGVPSYLSTKSINVDLRTFRLPNRSAGNSFLLISSYTICTFTPNTAAVSRTLYKSFSSFE